MQTIYSQNGAVKVGAEADRGRYSIQAKARISKISETKPTQRNVESELFCLHSALPRRFSPSTANFNLVRLITAKN